MATVYGLKDPFTGEIRYVGQSHQVECRYKDHLRARGRTAKDKWIKDLRLLGAKPELVVLERDPRQLLRRWPCHWLEREWVDRLTADGHRLTNVYPKPRVR